MNEGWVSHSLWFVRQWQELWTSVIVHNWRACHHSFIRRNEIAHNVDQLHACQKTQLDLCCVAYKGSHSVKKSCIPQPIKRIHNLHCFTWHHTFLCFSWYKIISCIGYLFSKTSNMNYRRLQKGMNTRSSDLDLFEGRVIRRSSANPKNLL